MTRELKVYGFNMFRRESVEAGNGGRNCRVIIAAHSVAEVVRLTGATRSEVAVYGGVTHNPDEVETALAEPGVAFWQQPKDRFKTVSDWNRVEPIRTEQ